MKMKKILLMLGCLITAGAQIVAGEPGGVERTFIFEDGSTMTTSMTDQELQDWQEAEAIAICRGDVRSRIADRADRYHELCYNQNKKPSIKEFEKYFFKNHYLPFTEANKAKITESKLKAALLHCSKYHDLQLFADKMFIAKITVGIAAVTAAATKIALSYMS